MFERFKEEVRAHLDSLRTQHLLPTELENPSTAKLRNYCLLLYSKGLSDDDKTVMIRFFVCRSFDELENSISSVDIDKLKPLRNYILGNTTNPTEDIIKLLAILIDFQPRPYAAWREQNNGENSALAETPSSGDGGDQENVVDIKKPKNRFINLLKRNKVVSSGIGVLGIAMSSLWGFKTLSGEECMCWNESQYIEIDCKSEQIDGQIIGLNDNLLRNFQKITRTDTLTATDANKIWYSKINHRVEFFTAPGFHPVHRNKSLKAATPYIIEKYGKSSD